VVAAAVDEAVERPAGEPHHEDVQDEVEQQERAGHVPPPQRLQRHDRHCCLYSSLRCSPDLSLSAINRRTSLRSCLVSSGVFVDLSPAAELAPVLKDGREPGSPHGKVSCARSAGRRACVRAGMHTRHRAAVPPRRIESADSPCAVASPRRGEGKPAAACHARRELVGSRPSSLRAGNAGVAVGDLGSSSVFWG
jgi:hypothetical protein